ncbi:16 kDa calcium-binding protein-like [Ostrea edulis]|uniref:16 kDa calcium-binding protein-like n=1 Tax=Ostrea edulis TaxID=37623 RepID=UPI0024AF574B|nr:16 kDa calcium-binding protein-like [Ostrea edulis]
MFAWHLHFLAKAVYNSMADLSVWVQRHLSRVQEDFDEVDKDKSGSLDFPEVCNVLQKSGFKGTPEEAKRIFQTLDVDKNSKISKDEYVNSMAKIPQIDFKQIALRRAFRKLDKDGSGFLTRDEILDAASNEAEINVSADKISDMLIYLVKDNDKKIDYEEFLNIWNVKFTTPVMRTLFQKLDKDGSGKLDRKELLDGLHGDNELHLQAPKIAAILIKWSKDHNGPLSYEEFLKAYGSV